MTATLERESAASAPQASTEQQASGSSFYAAMRLLPPAERAAMFAIYAFCRAVDDIADDLGGDRAARASHHQSFPGGTDAGNLRGDRCVAAFGAAGGR